MNQRSVSRIRQLAASIVGVATIAAGSLLFAAPAQAAELGLFTYTGSDITIYGNVGDRFSIANSSGRTITLVNVTVGAMTKTDGTACTGTACQISSGMATYVIGALGTVTIDDTTDRTLTFLGPSGGSAPPPLIQQFGKPVSGTCGAAAPAGLNWSGVGSGGWGESWAQWMNGGNGGPVCTRMLVYSTAQARWTVS